MLYFWKDTRLNYIPVVADQACVFEVPWRMEHARLNKQTTGTKIPVTSFIFRNFCFDYYTYRFGLKFRLGFG